VRAKGTEMQGASSCLMGHFIEDRNYCQATGKRQDPEDLAPI
jgi:hypothetical protein